MANAKYTPTTIPRKINATLYTHYCVSGYRAGEIINFDFNAQGEEYLLLAETPVTVKIPPQTDLKEKLIDALEAEKEKREAEHHMKMKELQERINSLLAIEFKAA